MDQDHKNILTKAIEAVGESGEALVRVSKDIIKEGAVDIGDLIHTGFNVGTNAGKDVIDITKNIVVGAVEATKEAGGSGEDAASEVIQKAEKAAGDIAGEGGEAVRKGIEEAKKVLKEPFK